MEIQTQRRGVLGLLRVVSVLVVASALLMSCSNQESAVKESSGTKLLRGTWAWDIDSNTDGTQEWEIGRTGSSRVRPAQERPPLCRQVRFETALRALQIDGRENRGPCRKGRALAQKTIGAAPSVVPGRLLSATTASDRNDSRFDDFLWLESNASVWLIGQLPASEAHASRSSD